MQKNQIEYVKKIETDINKNLFIICAVVTVVVMVMMVLEFFSRGSFPATQVALFYLGVLILYSLHKEVLRWLGKSRMERQGEMFVYAWIILTTVLLVINFLTRNYYITSPEGAPLDTMRRLSVLTVEVLGIFISTRILKMLKICLVKNHLFKIK